MQSALLGKFFFASYIFSVSVIAEASFCRKLITSFIGQRSTNFSFVNDALFWIGVLPKGSFDVEREIDQVDWEIAEKTFFVTQALQIQVFDDSDQLFYSSDIETEGRVSISAELVASELGKIIRHVNSKDASLRIKKVVIRRNSPNTLALGFDLNPIISKFSRSDLRIAMEVKYLLEKFGLIKADLEIQVLSVIPGVSMREVFNRIPGARRTTLRKETIVIPAHLKSGSDYSLGRKSRLGDREN